MGREANAYLPCLKCNLMIPAYAKEIHATECHTLNLKTFTHPSISESSLLGQALIMGEKNTPSKKSSPKNKSACQSTNKDKKNSGKFQKGEESKDKKEKSPSTRRGLDSKSANFVEEPEWLKKILPGFHYRIVVMNELDLIRCDITAYTPVLLEHSGSTCAFIAVPDDSVRIGHVMLHRTGCLQHFPSLTLNALIWVKKIPEVKLAEQISVRAKSPLSEEESISMECHLKNIMFSSYPLGAPFTVTVGSVVYPHTSDVYDSQSFTVVSCVCKEEYPCDGQLLESMTSLSVCDSDPGKPYLQSNEQSSVLDTSEQLLAQENHSCSRAYITIDEYKEGDSMDAMKGGDRSFMTSTPHKMSSVTDDDLRKSFLRTKVYGNETSIRIPDGKDVSKIREGIQQPNTWVRVWQNTKIVIERLPKDNGNASRLEKKDIYCRDNVYHVLVKILQNKLKHSKVRDNPYLSGWSGVLLYGPPGTGKTLLVREIAASINIKLITLTLSDVTKSSGVGSENVRLKFKLAVERAPAILFIDEIDSLCPAGEHRVTRENDLTRAVISGIQLLKTSREPVLLVAATSRIEGVSMKLRCSGRFDKELLVPLPNAQQRIQILKNLMQNHHHKVSNDEISDVAKQAYGYSGADLDLLLKCAWLSHVQKNKKHGRKVVEKPCLYKEDLEAGMAGVVPTILRQDFQAVFVVKWKDIFGYEALKSRLQKMIHQHISDPENHPLKGLLLYGPPGCSKTMFVKALVNETSFSFFPLKCSDLLSKYVGETEKSLSKVFGRARQTAPSIIFMDEIDSLCSDREDGSGLVSELLSLMSEIALMGNILVIGATNRPHVLDEALLKPRCLEQVIHVDLPDFECRCAIWRGILTDIPLEGEVNIEKLSTETAGYSGAEIAGIYQHAAQTVISQVASRRQEENRDGDRIAMTEESLLSAIRHLPARTPSSLLEKIKEFSNSRCSLPSR